VIGDPFYDEVKFTLFCSSLRNCSQNGIRLLEENDETFAVEWTIRTSGRM